TIKLLMGMIHATRGAGTVFGLDVDRDAVRLKKRIGYVPGELPQWGGWRGEELVAYVSGIRGGVCGDGGERVARRRGLDLSRSSRASARIVWSSSSPMR